jgi:hypothetical protein
MASQRERHIASIDRELQRHPACLRPIFLAGIERLARKAEDIEAMSAFRSWRREQRRICFRPISPEHAERLRAIAEADAPPKTKRLTVHEMNELLPF